MTSSTQKEEVYSTGFLIGLAVVAIVLFLVAGYLWFFRTPDPGPLATIPDRETSISTQAGPASAGTDVLPPAEAGGPPAVGVAPDEATSTSEMGTIEGQVALEGRNNHSGIDVLVDDAPATTTDVEGAFQVTVPIGAHTVRAGRLGFAAAETTVDVPAGASAALPFVTLPAGDTDGDADIDLFDIVRCAINLGQPAPAGMEYADVNGDGVIDMYEIGVIHRNYRTLEPITW